MRTDLKARLTVLTAELEAGSPIRTAAKRARISTSTAHRYSEVLTPRRLKCGCGRIASHAGLCVARGSGSLRAQITAIQAQLEGLQAMEAHK